MTLAFDTTKTIFTSYRSSFWDTAFVDGINTLVEFVASTDIHAINMEAWPHNHKRVVWSFVVTCIPLKLLKLIAVEERGGTGRVSK